MLHQQVLDSYLFFDLQVTHPKQLVLLEPLHQLMLELRLLF